MSKKSEEAKQAKELKQIAEQGNLCLTFLGTPLVLGCTILGIKGGYFLAQWLNLDGIGLVLLMASGFLLGIAPSFAFVLSLADIVPIGILVMATSSLFWSAYFQPNYWPFILPIALLCIGCAVSDTLAKSINWYKRLA